MRGSFTNTTRRLPICGSPKTARKQSGSISSACAKAAITSFHDVVGLGFNVDHVIVGPAGVFTVETKTWSKPAKGDAKVVFDGERVRINGFEPDRNPIVQAKAQARWLKEVLAESTGMKA